MNRGITTAVFALCIQTLIAQSLDPSFHPVFSRAGEVRQLFVLPDGKLLIQGRFDQIGGQSRRSLAQLLPDGSADPAFLPDPSLSLDESAIVHRLPGGKLLVGSGGQLRRLHSDGSLDASFLSPSFNGTIQQIRSLGDSLIYVCGDFDAEDSFPSPRLLRLRADGSCDTLFRADSSLCGSDDQLRLCLPLPDGRVYIAGLLRPDGGNWLLARLKADGSRDSSFSPSNGLINPPQPENARIWDLMALPSGSMVLAAEHLGSSGSSGGLYLYGSSGQLSSYYASSARVTSLASDPTGVYALSNGTLFKLNQSSWFPAITNLINGSGRILRMENGVIYIGGQFTKQGQQNTLSLAAVDLNSFTSLPNFAAQVKMPASIHTFDCQSGKIIADGQFDFVDGSAYAKLVRLNADGSLDGSFSYSGPRNARIGVQADGRIVVSQFNSSSGRQEFKRLLSSGATDNGFQVFNAFLPDAISGIHFLNQGRMLITGKFSYLLPPPLNLPGGGMIALENNGFVNPNFINKWGFGERSAALALQSGKVLVGSQLVQYQGNVLPQLARVNGDYTHDASFQFSGELQEADGSRAEIYAFAEQPDSLILVGGSFRLLNSQPFSPQLIRLRPSGIPDSSFRTGTGFSYADGSPARVERILWMDSVIFVCGKFDRYQGYEVSPGFAALRPNGDPDLRYRLSFLASGSVLDIKADPANPGSLLLCGDFVVAGNQAHTSLARIAVTTAPAIPTSLAGEQASAISLYPNPAQASLRFRLPEGFRPGAVAELLRADGARIRQIPLAAGSSEQTLSLEGLPAGFYWLRVLQEGKAFSAALTKEASN
jgi:uncharacterized delta-60 repeat protein